MRSLLVLCLATAVHSAEPPKIPAPPSALTKSAPESVADLKAIQDQTRAVLEKVVPCTVGLQIGMASGSGVIVSKDGLVLTAAHVSGKPGQAVTIILPDGKRVKGKTLGNNPGIDSGMVKIDDPREWPYVELAKSADLVEGQWLVATGHPKGWMKGRPPVVRLGRVLKSTARVVETDCALVGGDSGGPLFDMQGRVVGIHSRIGGSVTTNYHVPSDTFTDTWDRLAKGDEIKPAPASQTYLGVSQDDKAKNCLLGDVTKDSPADKGGLKAGDVITSFDGKKVKNYDDMREALYKRKPGDEILVEVRRGDETLRMTVTLGKRN